MPITQSKLSLLVLGLICLSGAGYSQEYDYQDRSGEIYSQDASETCSNDCDSETLCGNIIPRAPDTRDLYPQRCLFPDRDCSYAETCGRNGIWLPECPVLFRPFLADPRQITYSAGWRWNDQVFAKNVIDVSFGDHFAIYRWCDIYGGQLQVEIEGAAWATFDPFDDNSILIDTDYYCGIPITYKHGDWQLRLRGYHISTHMGDEYLVKHPNFYRRNPSAEFVDFFFSHDFTDEIRYYAGAGVVVHQDESFRMGRVFLEGGAELRFRNWGFTDLSNQLYGEPYYAMHFRWRKDFKHHVDQTYAIGYEIGKLCGLCRKLRLFLEYHDGYSLEGQFQKRATNYVALRFSYGY